MRIRSTLTGLLVLAACAAPTVPNRDGEWRLAELAGAPADAPTPTLTIVDADIGGFTGCNRFSGRIEEDPNVAAFFRGDVAVTEMYCEAENAMAMERVLLDALYRTGDIRREDEGLVFYDVNAQPIMRFERER